jgi:hypothetical protein
MFTLMRGYMTQRLRWRASSPNILPMTALKPNCNTFSLEQYLHKANLSAKGSKYLKKMKNNSLVYNERVSSMLANCKLPSISGIKVVS